MVVYLMAQACTPAGFSGALNSRDSWPFLEWSVVSPVCMTLNKRRLVSA